MITGGAASLTIFASWYCTIHYNCIGAFDVPDRRKIPETDIIMETRKGVALSYAPERLAV